MGRLDENIAITAATQIATLSCSSLYNRVDLYALFGQLVQTEHHRTACHDCVENERCVRIPAVKSGRLFVEATIVAPIEYAYIV